MGKDLDEDLIEATIRRVADAANAAAREAAGPEADEVLESAAITLEAADAATQARRVESLVRRVADAKAARLAEPSPPAGSGSERDTPRAAPASFQALPAPRADTEDLIEATIRRVAAAKAAQGSDVPSADPEEDRDAGALPRAEQIAANPAAATPVFMLHRATPEPSAFAPLEAPAFEESAILVALRRDLDETRAALATLSRRVDALVASPDRGIQPASHRVPLVSVERDEEWDDSPTMPRLVPGQMPRPAIFRDGPRDTATSEPAPQGEEEIAIDTRPIPKPLPPLHAQPKRGVDLLPRTYRVTVEDKRRGVDLVPLHRALLGMEGVRDMSLLSYSNGVAIVSLDTLDELDPDALCAAIARAMGRSRQRKPER